MRKLPQIVRERLKASPAMTGHPDADILTAFAEHSLSEPERVGVLAHLASCGDCREILSLALPPIDTGRVAPVAVRRAWLTWPAFRWGFATAGVALIALAVIQLEHHRNESSATLARHVAPAPMAAEAPKPTSPVPATTADESALEKAKAAPIAKKDIHSIAEDKGRFLDQPAKTQPENSNAAASSGMAVAKLRAPEAPPPAMQTVEVQAQGPSLTTPAANSQIAQSSPANHSADQFFGYNSGPLSRAKPADIQPAQTEAAGAVLVSPRWSITAVGSLQRSLDQGKTWQDIDVNASAVPPASGAATGAGSALNSVKVKPEVTHAAMAGKASVTAIYFRAVTAAGNEVWAGGSKATLFHSADGGNHWTRVTPSSSGAVLTGDVVGVEFSDPQHGTVTTSTPEVWTTGDGGQTWQKH